MRVYEYSFERLFSILEGIYPEVELLDHLIILVLRNCHAVFYSGCISLRSHQHGGGSPILHVLKVLYIICLSSHNQSHLSGYDVVLPLSVTVVLW